MTEKDRVGSKIRQLREAQNMSVSDLAERSHASIQLIEQLESGKVVLSLSPLLKIARALGVRLGTFLDDAPQQGAVVVRAGQSEEVVRFSHKSDASPFASLDFHSLGANKQDRHMEPFIVDMHPATEEDRKLSTHEGEEFIYVLAGEVELFYGKQTHQIGSGDSIYYDSIVPHNLHAAGDGEAKILAVVYAPF